MVDSSSIASSQISTDQVKLVIEHLKGQKHRDSMKKNYYAVWKLFNKFFLRLDKKPQSWGDRLILFVGHLITEKKQSAMV